MKQALQKLLIDFLKEFLFGDWFGREDTTRLVAFFCFAHHLPTNN
jgi:hypothetical protein